MNSRLCYFCDIMSQREKLITLFDQLGARLRSFSSEDGSPDDPVLTPAVSRASAENPWFTPVFVLQALHAIGSMLHAEDLIRWLSRYEQMPVEQPGMKRVGVIAAGNIPAAGFHDFLCVIMSGHSYVGKLSSKDQVLLPAIAEILSEDMEELRNRIRFPSGKLDRFDMVIATGSNNSSRYFDYYFRNYPSVIRRNRNGVAVITGRESDSELKALGDDIFLYFGLGCRSVSKLYIPAGYDVTALYRHWERYAYLADHYKYHNNYEYNKSICLVNRDSFFDNGFLLLRREVAGLSSPVSVLYYDEYENTAALLTTLDQQREGIQCVVGLEGCCTSAVPFGKSQFPGVDVYPDGTDILAFLTKK